MAKGLGQADLTRCTVFGEVLIALETMYLKFELHLSVRDQIAKIWSLPDKHTTSRVIELLEKMDYYVGCLTPSSYGADDLLPWLVTKIRVPGTMRARMLREHKPRQLELLIFGF